MLVEYLYITYIFILSFCYIFAKLLLTLKASRNSSIYNTVFTFGFLKFLLIKSLPKRISKTFSKFMIIIYYEHYESSFVYWQLALWVMAAIIGRLPHDDNDDALRVSLQSRKLALWTPKKPLFHVLAELQGFAHGSWLSQSAEPGTCDNNNRFKASKMQFNARLTRCVWRERVWRTLLQDWRCLFNKLQLGSTTHHLHTF